MCEKHLSLFFKFRLQAKDSVLFSPLRVAGVVTLIRTKFSLKCVQQSLGSMTNWKESII